MEQALLTNKEAAAYLRISEQTLRVLALDGTIPCVQRVSGGKRFFRLSALDRYIEASEHRGTKTVPLFGGTTYRKRRIRA